MTHSLPLRVEPCQDIALSGFERSWPRFPKALHETTSKTVVTSVPILQSTGKVKISDDWWGWWIEFLGEGVQKFPDSLSPKQTSHYFALPSLPRKSFWAVCPRFAELSCSMPRIETFCVGVWQQLLIQIFQENLSRRYHAAEFSSSSAFSTEVAQICRALCTCHRWCEE